MKSFQARSAWMGLMALLVVALLSNTALAQDSDEESGPTRMAVLNVPGGGTEVLHDKLAEISDLEVLKQTWFIKQIQNRGFDPKGIMRRPKDLKWVMDGGDLDYVLFLAPVSEQAYEARIVGKDGTIAKKLSVDRTPDGLSESGAELVRRELQDFLTASEVEVSKLGGPDDGGGEDTSDGAGDGDEELDPNELKARAATEKDATSKALSKNWLYASAGMRFTKRDFNVVASNEETVSYRAVYYPALDLGAELFPFGMTNADLQAIGFYLGFRYGADGFETQRSDGTAVTGAIKHPEFTAGVAIRGENPAKDMDSDEDPRSRLLLGFRYVNFPVEYTPADDDPTQAPLPSISHLNLTIGGKLAYPVGVSGLFLTMEAEIIPASFFLEDPLPFGKTYNSYGLSGEMGAIYKFTDAIGLHVSYGGRVMRANFDGEGIADFANPADGATANFIELVQGFSAGLQYHY